MTISPPPGSEPALPADSPEKPSAKVFQPPASSSPERAWRAKLLRDSKDLAARYPMVEGVIDSTISVLVDLTGANERVFKSPIPLMYTRLTARFLTFFLTLLPLALWGQLGESWNHWATIPASFIVSFFLFGIEEVGVQIEEPFSILPLEAMCNGAIQATCDEMLDAVQSGVFEEA